MNKEAREFTQELANAALVFGAGTLWAAWMIVLGQGLIALFQ